MSFLGLIDSQALVDWDENQNLKKCKHHKEHNFSNRGSWKYLDLPTLARRAPESWENMSLDKIYSID